MHGIVRAAAIGPRQRAQVGSGRRRRSAMPQTPRARRRLPPRPTADADVVLIVDDVPDNLSLLHDALDEFGYTVLVATNGEQALQRAAQAVPDIVLLDAVMPGMDGFEVARRLKADAGHRAHPDRLHDRPDRDRARARGLRGRRRRLRHQADPADGGAGAHRRARAGRARAPPGAQRARRLRPRDDRRCAPPTAASSGRRRWRGSCCSRTRPATAPSSARRCSTGCRRRPWCTPPAARRSR